MTRLSRLMKLPDHIVAENKRLCEARTAIPVSERACLSPESIQRVSDGEGKPIARERNGRTEHLAQIGDADKIGLNGRGYPRELWNQQIERYKSLLDSGMLIGCVDHTGPLEGGSLKHAAVIWRELSMRPDGAVMGWYQITESTAGRDLSQNKKAGMSIGFSTQGYGAGRPLIESDRQKFGIPESETLTEQDPETGDEIPKYVVMTDWRMCRADCVDDPSFVRARDQYESMGAVSASQLKTEIASRAERITESKKHGSAPPPRDRVEYLKGHGGDLFTPSGPVEKAPTLDAHTYRCVMTWDGPAFLKLRPETDDLYRYPGSVGEKVLSEIDAFWKAKPKYEKMGVMFNRGVLLHGPPGTGKSSLLHMAAEDIAAKNDVFLFAEDIGTLISCLKAFREVEPDRKVVVAIEDCDQMAGYQEHAFLQLLDGGTSIQGVCYVGTTNYKSRIPERMLRPGRFDRLVFVGPPPKEGRIAYLSKKLGGIEPAEEIDRLADATEGLSFGHLRELITAVYVLDEPKESAISRLQGGRPAPRTESAHSENVTPRLSSTEQSGAPEGSANLENDSMKTFAELKAAHPELAASIETSTQQAVDTAVAPVKEKCESLVGVVNDLLVKVKDLAGIELPMREVLPAETAQQIEQLKTELAAERTKVASVEQAKQAAEALVAKAAAEKAESDRQSKVTAAFEAAVKDNAYINGLRKAFAKPAADPKFGESDVAAFIKETVELFEAAGLKPERGPETGLTGVDVDPDELPAGEGAEGPVFAG